MARASKKYLVSVISFLDEQRKLGVLEQGQHEKAQRAVRTIQNGIRTRNPAKVEIGVNALALVFLQVSERLSMRR